jgi:hypothetical protein
MAQESREESWICLQRRTDRRKRLHIPTLLVSQNSEKMERIKVVRPYSENLRMMQVSGLH